MKQRRETRSCCSVAQSCPNLHDPMDWNTRLPCPTLSPRVCTLMSIELRHSMSSYSSCPQSFPASGSFPKSQLFTWGGQNIGASASASVLPMNIQHWFPLRSTGLISCSPRDSQESSPTPQLEDINSSASAFFMVHLSHPRMTTGKTIGLIICTFVGKVMSLLFNMLSRFVIAFLQRATIF